MHSQQNQGQRRASDFYETPYTMTEKLLANFEFDYKLKVLEPAAGNNAIVQVLRKYFNPWKVEYSDIVTGQDFLEREEETDHIITNPPFSLWSEFVKKSKEICHFKFAFLGKIDFLSGIGRYRDGIYTGFFPLTKVFIFVRKPDIREFRINGKYKTGIDAYAWYIWERDPVNPGPRIFWIDNNDDIARKSDEN